jgi:hypothetical protein
MRRVLCSLLAAACALAWLAAHPAHAQSADEPEPVAQRGVALQFAAGLGLGTLSFERPTEDGVQTLNETAFPAAELLVSVRAWPEQAFSLDVSFAYQTSLGLTLQLSPLFALPENLSVRTQRAELAAAPIMRLGGTSSRLSLALPMGLSIQSLAPEEHQYDMPSYLLGGPFVRPEARIELGEIVQLRAGPDLQWIVLLSESLRERGVCCQGIAFGGQGAIEASVGTHVSVALAYREMHAFAPGSRTSFQDVQRFLTARVAGAVK